MMDNDGIRHDLKPTRSERDLDVLVSDDLKLGEQFNAAADTAWWKLGVLKKAVSSRSRQLWEIIWKTDIRLVLEHAIQAGHLTCERKL